MRLGSVDPDVRAEAALGRLLETERALADRARHEVSLVVLGDAQQPSTGDWGRFVAEEVPALVRSTDRVERLDDGQLAIVLPNTSSTGARRLSSRIRRRVADRVPGARVRASYRVYPPTDDRRFVELRRDPDQERTQLEARQSRWLRSPRVECDARGAIALTERELPAWKRATDLMLASAAIVVLAPLMLLIAAAVTLTSPGPVIYRQERTGRGLRRFQIYKFRTMRQDAHAKQHMLQSINEMSGPLFKSQRDPRLTPIGAFLRTTSLDELPQLVNVLMGEMTLVGPRALSPLPSAYEPWQLRRFIVTPGVACAWQAFRRGETDFREWMRSDLQYVDRGFSIVTDLRLLVATVKSVLTCSGGR